MTNTKEPSLVEERLLDEARNEIERQQIELEHFREQAMAMRAEIERLTRERDEVSLLAVNRLIEIDRVRARYDSATDQAVRYADDNVRLRALRSAVAEIVGRYEDGQNHDEGAFDADCPLCRILADLRRALENKP